MTTCLAKHYCAKPGRLSGFYGINSFMGIDQENPHPPELPPPCDGGRRITTPEPDQASLSTTHLDERLLPDPFPDYLACPHCQEAEVEVWCYQAGGTCHNCGGWVTCDKPAYCGSLPTCPQAGKMSQSPHLPTKDKPG